VRARSHVTVWATAFAVVLLAACNGDGDGNQAEKKSGSGSMTSGPRFPDPRTEVTGAFWDGKIAVAGGLTPEQSTDRFDVFDVSSGRWSSGPTLPHQYDHTSLAELGGRLYIVGGYLSGLSNPTNEVFSLGPGETTWRMEPGMAARRGALATASAAGRLVAIGGVDQGGNVLRTTEVFTPGAGWSAGPTLSIPREHLAAIGAGEKAYAIAGRNADGATTTVEALVVGDSEWKAEPALHDERSGIGAATTASGRICTGGGEVPGKPDTVPSIECLDGGSWDRVANLSTPRHGLAVAAEGNRVHFVAGGPQPGASYSEAHEVLAV
jgi:Kelch motif